MRITPRLSLPQAQRVGILIDAVNLDDVFQMKMRTRGIAGATDLRDNLSGSDRLPRRNMKGRAMGVAGVSVKRGVVNQDLIAVAVAEIVSNDDLPVEE